LAVVVLTTGCVTFGGGPRISTSGPGWRVLNGQAVWRPGHNRPELGGDLLVARHENGSYIFDFEKTPLPITMGHATSTNWLIQFPARRFSFGGKGQPPVRFTWLYLGAALDGKPLPRPFCFERKPDGGWLLQNTNSGESIEGFLTP
jgi:hypothetical protein